MSARIYQDGFEPGSSMTIRARLTQNELSLVSSFTTVLATVRHPDGVEDTVKLRSSAPGLFEANYPMTMPGIYTTRMVATGRSRLGDAYRREKQLTGVVWF